MDRKVEIIPMKQCRGDSCHQGRLPCQTPQACEVAEEDDVPPVYDWIGLGLAALALLLVWGMMWVITK